MRNVLLACVLPLGGCFLLGSNTFSVPYSLEPEELVQDFGSATGTLPSVTCDSAASCSMLPTAMGATATCEAGQCVLQTDVRLAQTVNLSQQAGFPANVASSVVQRVEVQRVRYWTADGNTFNTTTPAVELYIGSQSVQRETDTGASLLGTLLPITPGSCPVSEPCEMDLTPAGRTVFATLAKEYKTPFNLLAVGHLTARGGDPVPAGRLDLLVRPTIAFVIPLK